MALHEVTANGLHEDKLASHCARTKDDDGDGGGSSRAVLFKHFEVIMRIYILFEMKIGAR